jgi:hypothetical protein
LNKSLLKNVMTYCVCLKSCKEDWWRLEKVRRGLKFAKVCGGWRGLEEVGGGLEQG